MIDCKLLVTFIPSVRAGIGTTHPPSPKLSNMFPWGINRLIHELSVKPLKPCGSECVEVGYIYCFHRHGVALNEMQVKMYLYICVYSKYISCVVLHWALYGPVVTVLKPSLTFSNATFCPQSRFICFVWIAEQRAITSLYRINWLVFITETVCIFSAVGPEGLNKNEFALDQHESWHLE